MEPGPQDHRSVGEVIVPKTRKKNSNSNNISSIVRTEQNLEALRAQGVGVSAANRSPGGRGAKAIYSQAFKEKKQKKQELDGYMTHLKRPSLTYAQDIAPVGLYLQQHPILNYRCSKLQNSARLGMWPDGGHRNPESL